MIQFLRQKRATILFAGLISLMVVLMSHDVGNRGGTDIAAGRASLLIDRGSSDGVLPNMPVVALGGVVGKVVLCSPSLAKVQCVGDPASGVAVVLESSGYQGMLVGRSVGVCDLIYVPPYAEVG